MCGVKVGLAGFVAVVHLFHISIQPFNNKCCLVITVTFISLEESSNQIKLHNTHLTLLHPTPQPRTHSECAAQGHTEQVQGDAVQYHFVCLFPAAPSSPHTIIELDGLKSAPIVHVLEKEGKEEEGKEGEGGENGKESFLLCGAKVLQRKFLARFANPEETAMNVLALVREEEEEGEGEGEA